MKMLVIFLMCTFCAFAMADEDQNTIDFGDLVTRDTMPERVSHPETFGYQNAGVRIREHTSTSSHRNTYIVRNLRQEERTELNHNDAFTERRNNLQTALINLVRTSELDLKNHKDRIGNLTVRIQDITPESEISPDQIGKYHPDSIRYVITWTDTETVPNRELTLYFDVFNLRKEENKRITFRAHGYGSRFDSITYETSNGPVTYRSGRRDELDFSANLTMLNEPENFQHELDLAISDSFQQMAGLDNDQWDEIAQAQAALREVNSDNRDPNALRDLILSRDNSDSSDR